MGMENSVKRKSEHCQQTKRVWQSRDGITVNVLESGGGTGNAQRHATKVTVSDLTDTTHLHVFQVV